jgi:hypothetical protein
VPDRPFEAAAKLYRDAGWLGVLPLPSGRKHPPPDGYTGAEGIDPSWPDMQAWLDGPEAGGNIALRLPKGVVGIDVDAYAGKAGQATWEAFQAEHGACPPCHVSTSRDDGISGIRLFRCDPGLIFRGVLGPDVEVIQYRHRYMLCWPSLVEGRLYRWLWPAVLDGRPFPSAPDSDGVTPRLGDLLWLPQSYAEELSRPEAGSKASVPPWPMAPGRCARVETELTGILARLSGAGSRHDTMLSAISSLVHLGAEGHRGVSLALDHLRPVWVATVSADRSRTTAQAASEFERMVTGAQELIGGRYGASAALGSALDDPCANPFSGIVPGWRAPDVKMPASVHTQAAKSEGSEAGGAMTGESEPNGFVTEELYRRRVRRDATMLFEAEPQTEAWRQDEELRRRTVRREADEIEAAQLWREPVWLATLTEELALPDEPLRYTVAAVLPEGGNVLLTAQYKTGKTTLMVHLAKALVDRCEFLGRFTVEESRRVAIWNYEVTPSMFRRWLRDAAILNTDCVFHLPLRGYSMPLTTRRGQDWAVAWLTECGATAWIVDPAARAMVGLDENSNTDAAIFLDALDTIKERAGILDLILPTHTGRVEMAIGQERARGATRFDDWADVRWLLTKDDQDIRYFRATGRDVDVPEGGLSFDPLTRALTLKDGGRKVNKGTDVQNAIMEKFAAWSASNALPVTQNQVEAMVTGKGTTIRDGLAALVGAGLLAVTSGPGRSKLYGLGALYKPVDSL